MTSLGQPFKLIFSELQYTNIENLTSQDVKLINTNVYKAQVSILPKLPTTFLELNDIFDSIEFQMNNIYKFLYIKQLSIAIPFG